MKNLIIILIILLSSCSANWHLKRAVKKNPELGKPKTTLIPVILRDTVKVEIPGKIDSSEMKFRTWFNQAKDSMAVVYQDSLLKVQQTIDSLGNIKTKVLRIPYKVEVPVEIHDTVPVEFPAQITIEEKKWTNFDWIMIIICLILFLLLLFSIKK